MWLRTEVKEIGDVLLALYVSVVLVLHAVQRRCERAESGQSMVEYAIVVALVALIAMAGVQAFGQGVQQVFQQLLSKIQSIGI